MPMTYIFDRDPELAAEPLAMFTADGLTYVTPDGDLECGVEPVRSLYTTKPRRLKWCGGWATLVEVARTRNAAERCGERVIVHRWEDPARVEVKHCKGDGRTDGFREFQRATLPSHVTDAHVLYVASQMLKEKNA